ncbi:MAG: D-alanine--D-alanine ligase [Candidatus Omnitrophica bacterium]|nr:D-alanine--D-alanine ligase [Candidatus Omnitrophota bacterium]
MQKKVKRIGVLAGGPSSERAISLESGKAVFEALKDMGYDTVLLDVKGNLTGAQIKGFNIDVAFLALHGKFGEDGTIQKMLENVGIPYTGSGPLASHLALDKIASTERFVASGLDVPQYRIVNKKILSDARLLEIAEELGFPLVVKPQYEGSSIGISIVENMEGLRKAVSLAFDYGDKAIVNEYIGGRELTVGILNDEPLPVVEIVSKERFFDFNAKYKSEQTQYIAPAKIDPALYKAAQEAGKLAHASLGCRSFSRVDMMLDEKQRKVFVLEVNSIPGLTSHSLLPKAAACTGMDFGRLCTEIVKSAATEA